jgi:hypothetical protein
MTIRCARRVPASFDQRRCCPARQPRGAPTSSVSALSTNCPLVRLMDALSMSLGRYLFREGPAEWSRSCNQQDRPKELGVRPDVAGRIRPAGPPDDSWEHLWVPPVLTFHIVSSAAHCSATRSSDRELDARTVPASVYSVDRDATLSACVPTLALAQ